MEISQLPSCPKCGQAPRKVNERRADLSGGYFDKPAGSPKETIYTLECQCGTRFTHTVKERESVRIAG